MGLNGAGGRQNPFHVAKLFASNGFFMDYKGSGYWDFRLIEVLCCRKTVLSVFMLTPVGCRVEWHFVPAHITIQKEDDEGQSFSMV